MQSNIGGLICIAMSCNIVLRSEKVRFERYTIVQDRQNKHGCQEKRGSMQYKDYYNILEVDKSASQNDIKKSYRKLAKKYHPDTNPGNKQAEEKFKDINEAYEVLGDPEKRKKYDTFGQGSNFSNGYDFDPSQYGFGNNVKYEYKSGGTGNHSDFFNMFFGGNGFDLDDLFGHAGTGARRRNPVYDGDNVEAELEVTIEEGLKGSEKKISLRGRGEEKSLSFKIPKGVKDGERIRLQGQGGPGANGGRNGDLYLNIRIRQDQRYKIEGNNLLASVDVFPWEAALGGEKTVETPDGRILVKIPAGIQTDSKIRVAGKGYIDRENRRGDLFIKVRIVNPQRISNEMKELYEKLRLAAGAR